MDSEISKEAARQSAEFKKLRDPNVIARDLSSVGGSAVAGATIVSAGVTGEQAIGQFMKKQNSAATAADIDTPTYLRKK